MPVSGLVLFAKSSKALTRMNEIFQKRQVEKHYIVKVHNTPPENKGTLTHWLRRDETKNITKAFDEEVTKAIKAQLEYTLIKKEGKFSWLKIKLLTGRKHQIRAQLAYIGCSIVGDMKYGAPSPNKDQSICLHSFSLSFIHPVKKEFLLVETKMPDF
jgi:23S rRNA pseudouridine1911/1915/1917 synthase